jgi:hypothetical protein
VTIRGGNAINDGGGGILAQSRISLTIVASTITGNRAFGVAGVSMNSGSLGIINSRIENNQSQASIGGIATGANTSITNSTISGNRSNENVGGLAVNGLDTTTSINRSTITGNTGFRLGGMEISNTGGSVELVNVTISGNTALSSDNGTGGLFFDGNAIKSLSLRNVTITRNTGSRVGGMVSGRPALTSNNTIIANNGGGDCFVPQGSIFGTNNLTGDTSCPFFSPNNQRNTNPQLGPLALNGAANGTLTHALLDTSPARDRGNNATCATSDQRSIVRPQNGTCDIGAFEHVKPAAIGTATLLPTELRVTTDQTTTLTLRWTVPPTMTWQDLRSVDLQFAHGDTMPVVVRFSQGITSTDELTDTPDIAAHQALPPTNMLTLFDGDSDVGMAVMGMPMVIAGEHAMLDVGQTRLETDGPTGQTVAVTLAIAFKQPMAGKVFTVTLVASDDAGATQGPESVGTLAVGPFAQFLPLVVHPPSTSR